MKCSAEKKKRWKYPFWEQDSVLRGFRGWRSGYPQVSAVLENIENTTKASGVIYYGAECRVRSTEIALRMSIDRQGVLIDSHITSSGCPCPCLALLLVHVVRFALHFGNLSIDLL